MFTGIIEEIAEVKHAHINDGGATLVVQSALDHTSTLIGDSIAIDGVCLTLVNQTNGALTFEVALETLRRSSLGGLKNGSKVHIERSLKVGDRISGHFVFGHVDGVSKLISRTSEGESLKLVFELCPDFKGYIVPKGSVSLLGVSLTAGEVNEKTFSVYIVPHTQKVTKLGSIQAGDLVNVEMDMLARYVESLCQKR